MNRILGNDDSDLLNDAPLFSKSMINPVKITESF
jgi:hypothetical protein